MDLQLRRADDSAYIALDLEMVKLNGDAYLTRAAAGTVVVTDTGQTTNGTIRASAHTVDAAHIVSDATTARTLTNSDNGKTIVFTSASAVAVTLNTGLAAGFGCRLIQYGAGTVTVSGTATRNALSGTVATSGQYAQLEIQYTSTDTYNLRAQGAGGGSGTNLSYNASTRLLSSDTGTDVTLPLFTSSDAGLVTANPDFDSIDITTGTIAADTPALEISQAWNNAAVVFNADVTTITDTASSSPGGGVYPTLKLWKIGSTKIAEVNKNGEVRVYNSSNTSYGSIQQNTGALRLIVDGSVGGYVTSNSINATSSLTIGGDCQLSKAATGVITLSNGSGSFDRLQFGGTTSSFPAIKRNGTSIESKLADDSAYTTFAASSFGVNGQVSLASDGANIAAIKNGSNNCEFRVYKSGTNYLGFTWNGSYHFMSASDGAALQLYTPSDIKLRADTYIVATTPTFSVINQAGTAGIALAYEGYQVGAGNVVTDATTSRTLTNADNGKTIVFSSGSAVTVTVNTGLAAGFSCKIIQGGTGTVSINAGTATRHSRGSLFATNGQYAQVELTWVATDTYVISGDRA